MKYFFAFLLASLFWGCTKIQKIEFDGTATGIDDGVFTIKTLSDSVIIGKNIPAGKFGANKIFPHPGYFMLGLSKGKDVQEFEVYLESGKYTITTSAENLHKYPQIKSSSAIQNELSAYNQLAEDMNGPLNKTIAELTAKVKDPKADLLSKKAYSVLLDKLSTAQHEQSKADINILSAYMSKYPDSKISLHQLLKMNYEDDPVAFNKLYQKLSDADKKSDDGKELGDNIAHLLKLIPGGLAPAIAGTTPDGKTVDIKALNKKIILVEFWRAGAAITRTNHQSLVTNPLPGSNNNKLGIISISLDTRRNWWISSIKDDKLPWIQVSDLKGDDSPNVTNWGIHNIPTYYLVDGTGHIIERDIPFGNIDFSISDYLKKH